MDYILRRAYKIGDAQSQQRINHKFQMTTSFGAGRPHIAGFKYLNQIGIGGDFDRLRAASRPER
jgi:hypothetical protein